MLGKWGKILSAISLLVLSALSAAGPAVSAPARAPLAFAAFCAKNPGDCQAKGPQSPMIMDGKRWAELTSVNSMVNRSIRFARDTARLGQKDVWTVLEGGGAGDCEDYVLTKRRKLMQLGWPSSALLVTVVSTRTGEGHAVLTVRTIEGNFVLDNLARSVRPVHSTGYRFFSMQSPSNPRSWIRVPRSGPGGSADTAAKKVPELTTSSGRNAVHPIRERSN